jgi:hypothetical protein
LVFSIYLLSVCLFHHYDEGYFFFPMNFPCTAALEGSVLTIKLEVIRCIACIGKFRFLVSVEGKTLGGERRHSPPTTEENVNAIPWGRRESIHPSIAGERRECIHPSIAGESIHFSPSIAMELA